MYDLNISSGVGMTLSGCDNSGSDEKPQCVAYGSKSVQWNNCKELGSLGINPRDRIIDGKGKLVCVVPSKSTFPPITQEPKIVVPDGPVKNYVFAPAGKRCNEIGGRIPKNKEECHGTIGTLGTIRKKTYTLFECKNKNKKFLPRCHIADKRGETVGWNNCDDFGMLINPPSKDEKENNMICAIPDLSTPKPTSKPVNKLNNIQKAGIAVGATVAFTATTVGITVATNPAVYSALAAIFI